MLSQASARSLPLSSAHAVVSSSAEAAPALLEHKEDALLDADVDAHPAGWFGGFSEGESTYDYEGTLTHGDVNPAVGIADGWFPHQHNPFHNDAVSKDWFQETKSGGPKEAWQTFYPAEKGSVAGNRVGTGAWFMGDGGVQQQKYVGSTATLGTQAIPADWFDSSVNQ